MSVYTLERRQWVPQPLDETFGFYADPRNLARITPGWLGFRIIGFEPPSAEMPAGGGPPVTAGQQPSMENGLLIHYSVRPLGFPQRWTSRISEWDPPHRFVDEQVRGPYRRWRHLHEFRAVRGGTELSDRVTYELPFGPLGRLAHLLLVRQQLESIFGFRERTIAELFGRDEESEAS